RLGAYPLSDVEAQQSLVALGLEGLSRPDTYSPLLATLQSLIFLIFGASEESARLAPVLLGTGIVLLPILLRRHLGTWVCLLASAGLAISPLGLFLSRTVNAEIAVAAGALMVIAGFFNWAETGQKKWLFVFSGGLALMLAAGAMAISILIIFGLFGLLRLAAFKALWNRGLILANDLSVPDESVTETTLDPKANNQYVLTNPAAVDGDRPQKDDEDEVVKASRSTPDGLRQAGIFFVALLLILGTTALFDLSGFSILTGSVGEWLTRFRPIARPDSGFNAVFLLTIYEPLLVVSGLIGLTLVIMRGNLPATLFGGWFIGALLLDIAMAGRPDSNVILSLVPLAFLSAFALAELWQNLQTEARWSNEGLLTGTGLVIAGFTYIGFTAWLTRTCTPEDLACQYIWAQPTVALILFIVIAVFFAVINNAEVALRGVALIGVVIGVLSAISIGWRLNYGPLTHLAYQPVAGVPASIELVTLIDTLREQSARRVGDETLLDIQISGVNSAALLWQLRDFSHLSQGPIDPLAPPAAIITPTGGNLSLQQPYIGQDFALDAIWSPTDLSADQLSDSAAYKELFEWLLYRKTDVTPDGNRVVLWLRLDAS
ncbi:MAG: glycosyltransferase family 39 protein, partial [Anaerolineae bacterium]|nr:glycosyltransferase family 39 protein [Anaerolineae bacterium]